VSATITKRMRDRLAAPVVAVYWGALVVGLVLYSTTRSDPEALGAVWAGALVGTALGQGLALRNVRGWFAAAVFALGALVLAPILAVGGAPSVLWQVLVPAALCGFLSLGERTAAAAFWFPAMTCMLTVVDRLDGDAVEATMDARAFVVLGGVAAGFLALLWTAERRRLALFARVGAAPVVSGRAARLREPAGRTVARAGWWAAVAASTLALTAWVAPHLWQAETLRGERVTEFADGVGVGMRGALPCCPLVTAEAPRVRVREFLDVAHGVERPPARVGVNCLACDPDWRLFAAGGAGAATAPIAATTAPAAAAHAPGDVAPLPALSEAPAPPQAPTPTVAPPEPPPPVPTPPVVPAAPTVAEPPPVAPSPAPPAPQPTAARPVAAPMHAAPPRAPADASALVHLLVTLLVGAAMFVVATLALRPLRRAITLRHLVRPYWAESLEQRVSNLWQLALVGLRDAGWCARAGEQPEELARRVGVDGVGACAAVLERARHGLGLDEGDLAKMAAAADGAYRAARVKLGLFARAAAAVRWPLT
jgi:hypothetical protein